MKTLKLENFAGTLIYIGLDVHKNSWKVTLRFNQMEYKTYSMDPSPELLSQQLLRLFPGADYYLVYEAGFSGFWIQRRFSALGINCIVVNPADVPSTSRESKQKSDTMDSRKLAANLESNRLTPIAVPSQAQEAARKLVRWRKLIVKDTTRMQNRISTMVTQQGFSYPKELPKAKSWSRRHLSWVRTLNQEPGMKWVLCDMLDHLDIHREQLLKINREMRALSKTEPYKEDYQLLCSVPGIGIVGAMTLLTEIGDFDRFRTLDELASMCGLIPDTNDSGENIKSGRNTKRGNSFIKTILIEAAWIAIKNDPALAKFYTNLCQRMKGSKAIVRVAKKLLARIRAVIKTKTPYQINVTA